MTNDRTVIVAGGGIAGTVTAIALHKAGFSPHVHEAYDRNADSHGAFLTVAVNGLAALRALDIDPAALLAAGYPTPNLALGNRTGRRLADLPLGGPEPDGTTTTTIRRADLYAALRAEVELRGIPVAYGRRLVAVDRHQDAVTAVFANGSRATGALLVGADGLHSRTRRLLDPDAPAPRYLGLLNAGGFTTADVAADLDRTPGVLHLSFGRRCFFGWSAAPDGSIWWFANPPRKQPVTADGWDPARWRDHLLDVVAGDATGAAAIIRATGEVLGPWNTYDLPRVPVWRDARSVLVGDAAHAASPSSGQGASMAIEDAVTLATCLRDVPEVPAALVAYERLRRGRVEKVVAYGRRSSSTKVAGPVGAAIRDTMTPLVLRLLHRKGDPQAWIFDHRIDWDTPVPAAR
jgi:2-polyprenyl-6-methoxyphenol hydroxylase-like FAD-dependent oxidoreductase